MIKQLFIPIAVFAVTATTAAAFQNADWSELDINLSDTEIAALEKAQDIRQAAQDEAQSVLEAAGIDESRMKEIHDAEHSARNAERESMHAALEANDYTAFQAAIANSPLAEQITSEVDFKKFVEAHNLREADGLRVVRVWHKC